MFLFQTPGYKSKFLLSEAALDNQPGPWSGRPIFIIAVLNPEYWLDNKGSIHTRRAG